MHPPINGWKTTIHPAKIGSRGKTCTNRTPRGTQKISHLASRMRSGDVPAPSRLPYTASLRLAKLKSSTTSGGTTITIPPRTPTRSGFPIATTFVNNEIGLSL